MELIIAIVSICIFIALLSFSILKIWLPGYMVREMEQYQNKLLERQFEEIDNTYREMRGWRHDYKNHMQVLKIYVENRQWENARDYIVQMNEDLESIDHVIKTGNIMADAIVNSKVSLAKKKDIKLDVTAKIPKEIPMTDVEFCVVFGNIMDNAIEACEKLASKENKFFCTPLKDLDYIFLRNRIKISRWFICKNDFRMVDQCSCNRDPLLLSTRQFRWKSIYFNGQIKCF